MENSGDINVEGLKGEGLKNRSLTLPSFLDLVSQSYSIFKSRFWVYLMILAAPLILSVLLGSYGSVILMLLVPLATLALIISLHKRSENIGIFQSYDQAVNLLLAYYWLGIVGGLAVVGGTFVLIVPGVIFALWFIFDQFVLVTDGDRGLNALLKSREYVRGIEWQILSKIGFSLIFILPFFLISILLFKIPFLTDELGLLNLPGSLLWNILLAFFSVYLTCYFFVIFEFIRKDRKIEVQHLKQDQNLRKYIIYAAVFGALIIFFLTFSVILHLQNSV